YGTALVWSPQGLSAVAGLAAHWQVVYAGQIVAAGTVDQVLDTPQHPYTPGLTQGLPAKNVRGQPLRQTAGMTPNLLSLPAGCAFASRCPRRTAVCDTMPALDELAAGHRVRCYHPGVVAETEVAL